MNDKNCSNCKYKKTIDSDNKIACKFPLLSEEESNNFSEMAKTDYTQYKRVIKNIFGFTPDKNDISKNLFYFPNSFCPSLIKEQCILHSSIAGDAVRFQLKLDKHIVSFETLLMEVENKIKDKEKYDHILKSYIVTYQKITPVTNESEDYKNKIRDSLIEKLDKILEEKIKIDNEI